MVHQRNRRIRDQSGFAGSFDVPWSRQILDQWSELGSPQRNALAGSFDAPWSRQILDHWSELGSPQRNAPLVWIKFLISWTIHLFQTKEVLTVTVFGCLILINIDFYDFIIIFFSLVLGSIEKIYQTLKTVLHGISKHLKVCQKYSAAHLIFNSVFGNVVKDGLSGL